MSLIIKPTYSAVALLHLMISFSVTAAPIYPENEAVTPEPGIWSFKSRRLITVPLLEVSPVPADKPTSLPEFSDPMGLDIDTGLRVFTGNLYFMDLLANPRIAIPGDTAEIELPPGALRGIDILDDLDSLYLSYDGRSYDSSVLNLENAEIIKRKGLPVTSEGSPLSLTGFGLIADKRKTR